MLGLEGRRCSSSKFLCFCLVRRARVKLRKDADYIMYKFFGLQMLALYKLFEGFGDTRPGVELPVLAERRGDAWRGRR